MKILSAYNITFQNYCLMWDYFKTDWLHMRKRFPNSRTFSSNIFKHVKSFNSNVDLKNDVNKHIEYMWVMKVIFRNRLLKGLTLKLVLLLMRIWESMTLKLIHPKILSPIKRVYYDVYGCHSNTVIIHW